MSHWNRQLKDFVKKKCKGILTISAAFPKTRYQRCIIHQVRNTIKYVSDKNPKTIYQTPTEEKALDALEHVTEK